METACKPSSVRDTSSRAPRTCACSCRQTWCCPSTTRYRKPSREQDQSEGTSAMRRPSSSRLVSADNSGALRVGQRSGRRRAARLEIADDGERLTTHAQHVAAPVHPLLVVEMQLARLP